MDLSSFLRAILEDPDDDELRLVFADWLEEQGQPERAALVRVGCQRARTHHGDPAFDVLIESELEHLLRCRPAWLTSTPGVVETLDRGLYRLQASSRTAVTRLGKIPWLGQALAKGWLESIHIPWSNTLLARAVAAWKGMVRDVPLFVRPAPQIDDEGLTVYLEMPSLRGLGLEAYVLRNPAVLRLGECQDLLELQMSLGGEEGWARAVLEQAGRLRGLRRLRLEGNQETGLPGDRDLKSLARLKKLRRLELAYCPTLSDAGLEHLHGLGQLRRLHLFECPALTEAGVGRLRRALPGVTIDRR